ncbi:MAG: LysM peptidoglycan-binding domain-containing protein [Anaerolineales bacterium]|nr:LysM peptidoglycan-binding domain-containing protein [Anaerolineales bacterium]
MPAAPAYHTVVYGETLRIIAGYYGTTVYNLQLLNFTMYDPNYIYADQSIRIR